MMPFRIRPSRDEPYRSCKGLMEQVVIHSTAEGVELELVGAVAQIVELGQGGRTAKQAALNERTACSVKVVAGAGFEPATFRL